MIRAGEKVRFTFNSENRNSFDLRLYKYSNRVSIDCYLL